MTQTGRIIEYLENGKFICAFVYEDNGNRLRLLNQNSREINLPLNRIVHLSKEQFSVAKAREDIILILQAASKEREKLAREINLDEIWELVSEKPEEQFSINFLAGLFFGSDPSDDQTAAFLRAVIDDRLYFKYKAGMIQVHSPETVEQIKLMQEKEKQERDFISGCTLALHSLWKEGKLPVNWEEGETVLEILKDYYLLGKDAPEHDLARKLLKNAQLNGQHDVFHLLVKAGVWDEHENIPLLKNDIPIDFSAEAMAEVRKITIPSVNELLEAQRHDFRNLPVLTIDGPATRDYDDALHLEKRGENYLVGIHISDVGHFIKPGSVLFEEALKRGTSIYFPEKPLSMLPASLSEDKLSLRRNHERLAVSFLVLLSPTAEVLKYDLVHSTISVQRQLTYEEADRLIKQEKEMAVLAALSKMLRQKRVNNGALLLPVPELNIKISPDNNIEISSSDADTPSKILIAEFMILANILGAQYVADREAPGLFRSQMEPRQRIIDGFEKDLAKVIRQRKRLSPMSLLTTPKSHSGIGAPQYTTITSPIRRFLDLIMQLQISHLIKGQGVFFSMKDMKHYGSIILATLEKANQAKYLRQRYWILKYLEPKVGEKLPATVIEYGHKRTHVFLEEYLLDADLPLNSAFKVSPGDTIMVKLSKIDPLSNILRVEW
ncbi:MAG: RNB domain-containing ribonuclease [Deltaproteobacteria bacterium]|nr:RNB domain-containing ribonuclease [Deltaproteobacteria bacterium]